MSIVTETTLTERIRELLERSEDPSPHLIADSLLDDLTDEDRVDVLRVGLRQRVREELHRHRGRATGGATRSAKWDAVKSAAASGALDLAEWSVGLNGRVKWLLDCTPMDLDEAVDYHRVRAGGHAQRAESYERLADLVRERGAGQVSDLAEQEVRRALSA